jgi:hypothetical protein
VSGTGGAPVIAASGPQSADTVADGSSIPAPPLSFVVPADGVVRLTFFDRSTGSSQNDDSWVAGDFLTPTNVPPPTTAGGVVPFIRKFIENAAGDVVAVRNFDLEGVEYVPNPAGTVGICSMAAATGCSCLVTAGPGATVTGTGEPGDPYVISCDCGATTVINEGDRITITGPVGGPYTISADPTIVTAGDGIDVTGPPGGPYTIAQEPPVAGVAIATGTANLNGIAEDTWVPVPGTDLVLPEAGTYIVWGDARGGMIANEPPTDEELYGRLFDVTAGVMVPNTDTAITALTVWADDPVGGPVDEPIDVKHSAQGTGSMQTIYTVAGPTTIRMEGRHEVGGNIEAPVGSDPFLYAATLSGVGTQGPDKGQSRVGFYKISN